MPVPADAGTPLRMLFAAHPELLTPVLRIIHRVIGNRIALGPRAGQKVLSLGTVSGRDGKTAAGLCADALGVARMQRSAIRES